MFTRHTTTVIPIYTRLFLQLLEHNYSLDHFHCSRFTFAVQRNVKFSSKETRPLKAHALHGDCLGGVFSFFWFQAWRHLSQDHLTDWTQSNKRLYP